MKFELEMPDIRACSASTCAYNHDGECHARAITVGGAIYASCSTFYPVERVARAEGTSGVAACKVTECSHNRGLECRAHSIYIGSHGDRADCLTFESVRAHIGPTH